MDPTPTDISDKSGNGHNPVWVGNERPTLFTEGSAPDTQIPTTPSNLSATVVSTSQINLSWTQSTDNIGVTGYKIYRCQGTGCTPTVQLTTVATNSYSNTGLVTNTTYVYRVSAYDAAGNVSSQSTSASATTQTLPPDTKPPATPTNIQIN
jgi:chitodextrinase